MSLPVLCVVTRPPLEAAVDVILLNVLLESIHDFLDLMVDLFISLGVIESCCQPLQLQVAFYCTELLDRLLFVFDYSIQRIVCGIKYLSVEMAVL